MKRLLIEGWRGVDHSLALVNQCQILALASRGDVDLLHIDLPFAFRRWNTIDNDPGFAPPEQALIASLPPPAPASGRIDAAYRISSPLRGRDPSRRPAVDRSIVFAVTEGGFGPHSFASVADRNALLDRSDEIIVTPSEWSWNRIVEHGFPSSRVRVVPHGVETRHFRPRSPDEKARLRAARGLRPDEIVFVSIGAPLWNKGIDLLLEAFAILRLRGLPVRLLVKDQRALYGRTLEALLDQLAIHNRRLAEPAVRDAITVVDGRLSADGVASLLATADCYVSPYRAEGFNLPVLEAIACGVPVIATEGGATDDYCDDAVAIGIPGRFGRRRDEAGALAAFIEPSFEALVAAMARMAGPGWSPDDDARRRVLARHRWDRAAERLMRLAFEDVALDA